MIFIICIVSTSILLSFLLYLLRYQKSNLVNIVVLGDIGRSPRMQYHSISLANSGYKVRIIGYGGSIPIEGIVNNNKIVCTNMYQPPDFILRYPKIMVYVLKSLFQIVTLLFALLFQKRPKIILVQNPPAIPTLLVCLLAARIRRSRLVIDWHNYAYTILAMSAGQLHPIVKFAERYESILGRFADLNFCVSKAMKDDLMQKWGIEANVLYDKAPAMFRELEIHEKHTFYEHLANMYPKFKRGKGTNCNIFTTKLDNGEIFQMDNRPALLVSSTSWTEDEDFGLLYDALDEYERNFVHNVSVPIFMVITGKGPLKKSFMARVEGRHFLYVHFTFAWLEAEDYPVLLGCADFGISLHTSSSGLDLPMKIVDMYGCRLPVIAADFKCLPELIKHGKTGFMFKTSSDLYGKIKSLLSGFPLKTNGLQLMRKNIGILHQKGWEENWTSVVAPLL